jgi:hypothetical protein
VIAIEREPSWLDRLVMEFVRCLGFNYVIVAGYVAILLGRTRTTDDVDVVVDAASGAEVAARAARCGFKPLTLESNLDYEFRHASARFYKPPAVLPNFEVKPPRSFYQRYALARRVAVSIAGEVLYVSPLELQIVYKLWLGSDKDFEDAVFLYAFARSKGILNWEELEAWARRLGTSLERLRRSVGET